MDKPQNTPDPDVPNEIGLADPMGEKIVDTESSPGEDQKDTKDAGLETQNSKNTDAQELTTGLGISGVSGEKADDKAPRSRLKMFKNALRLDFQAKFMGNREDGQVFYRVEDGDPDEGVLYQKISGTFKKMYEKKDRLGEGTVGMVYKYTKRATGENFAVKIIKTRDEEMVYQIKEEFRFMKELQHEYIVKVYELYIDTDHARVYLVMEYMKGIEMFEYIQKIDHYQEETAKKLFRKLLIGIEYLHEKGVVHRDLKPNNIMVTKDGENLKILDFNVAKFYKNYKNYNALSSTNYEMSTYTGTIAYTAPEIFTSDHYTEEVDMWSAGCILYTMLAGYPPFMSEYVADLIEVIKYGTYDINKAPWDEVSEDAKNLVRGMLTKDPANRILPTQALKCAWLQTEEEKSEFKKMPLVMVFAVNNLRLNSVKILRKRTSTISTMLATSFTKMLRELTLENIDGPGGIAGAMKNKLGTKTAGDLGEKENSVEVIQEDANGESKGLEKVTSVENKIDGSQGV